MPLVEVVSLIVRTQTVRRLRTKVRAAHRVVNGSLALIGFRPEDPFIPPSEWQIPEGLFSVAETLPIRHLTSDDVERAWLFYAYNRSITLDLGVIFRSLRGTVDGQPK